MGALRTCKIGYLLCGPPGTGKISLIAAIANLLEFKIYDFEFHTVVMYIQQFKGWERGFAAGAGVMGLAVIFFIAGMSRYRLTTMQGGFEGEGGGGGAVSRVAAALLGRDGWGRLG